MRSRRQSRHHVACAGPDERPSLALETAQGHPRGSLFLKEGGGAGMRHLP